MTNLIFNSQNNIDIFTIVRITKINGQIIGLTSLENSFEYQNIQYISALNFVLCGNASLGGQNSSGYSLTVLNNMDITELKGANIEIGFGSKNNINTIYSFFIGNIVSTIYNPNNIEIDIMPIVYNLKRGIGDFFSNLCRAEFCDLQCKLDKKNFSFTGSIISANGRNLIGNHVSQNVGYFINGVISFANGNSFRILNDMNNIILIATIPDNPINVGDTYNIVAGCDKSVNNCRNIFNNIVNFRGEPFINS